MNRDVKVVAVIPARGNSKGVPRKNIKLLHGIPLVAYTIYAALCCKDIDLVVLSTEDVEIEELAIKYAKVLDPELDKFDIIHRPHWLSMDHVQNDETVLHALRDLQHRGIKPKIVVTLQPTSPLRDWQDISEAIHAYEDIAELMIADEPTVISVTESHGYFWTLQDGDFVPVGHNPPLRVGRQWEQNDVYQENGAVYVTNARKLSLYRTVRPGPYVPYVMDEERSIDINTQDDWDRVEKYMGENYKFVKYENTNNS